LYEKVVIPSLKDGEDRRDTIIDSDRAELILEWLATYEYASLDHIIFRLLWRIGCRIGALQSIDLNDYKAAEGRLKLRHRPQGGTSLKMGEKGERTVALNSQTVIVLNDYIEKNRNDVTDENGREPLLTTTMGRPTKSTLRRHVYRITQPCQRKGECPHDVSMDECDAKGYSEQPSQCPSIRPPHDIRRGAITHFLQSDVPSKAVEDRMNVQRDTLEKHYDQRTEESRAEQRRQYFEDV